MSKILALETATEACSAALLVNGEVTERFELAPRRHTELLLPMVAELLANAGIAVSTLDLIAFGAGPGSFTGVRVATSVAQGIALAHDLPVVPLSCLATLAMGACAAHPGTTLVPIMDARKQEIYAGVYQFDSETQIVTAIQADAIGSVEEFCLPTRPYVLVGAGSLSYEAQFLARGAATGELGGAPLYPRAADALRLAAEALRTNTTVAPEFAEPIYLRRAV